MTTQTKTRQSRTLFSNLPKRGGSITVEWFGPHEEDDALPVSLIDTVHITDRSGSRETWQFKPDRLRTVMMLRAFDVGFYKGQAHERVENAR